YHAGRHRLALGLRAAPLSRSMPMKKPRTYRPVAELLEDRRLLSYAVVDLGAFIPVHVNDAGVVIGRITSSGGTKDHAGVWTSSGGLQDLGTLGGLRSYAYGINAAGVVVGSSTIDASGNSHGFLIQPLDTNQDDVADLWFKDANQDGINDLMSDFT